MVSSAEVIVIHSCRCPAYLTNFYVLFDSFAAIFITMLHTCFRVLSKNNLSISSGRMLQFMHRSSSNSSPTNNPPPNKKDDWVSQGIKKTIENMEEDHSKLAGGYKIGKWRFYLESFVFKNLRPDIVPPGYRMCYRSGLETYANFGILGGGLTTLLLPWMIAAHFNSVKESPFEGYEVAIMSVGTFATVMAIYFIALKVPLRIYYSKEEDRYLVVMPTLMPFTTRQLAIRPGELLPPPRNPSTNLPWVGLQHVHKPTGTKILLDCQQFALPVYYNKLMGYDK